MSIENEIKKLNETLSGLIDSIVALNHTAQQLDSKPMLTPSETAPPETVGALEDAPPVVEEAPTNLTHADVGATLSVLANKYGAPAQDAIKQIILETAGTQALSQVSEEHLPIIMAKVAKYEDYMEANARG